MHASIYIFDLKEKVPFNFLATIVQRMLALLFVDCLFKDFDGFPQIAWSRIRLQPFLK